MMVLPQYSPGQVELIATAALQPEKQHLKKHPLIQNKDIFECCCYANKLAILSTAKKTKK